LGGGVGGTILGGGGGGGRFSRSKSFPLLSFSTKSSEMSFPGLFIVGVPEDEDAPAPLEEVTVLVTELGLEPKLVEEGEFSFSTLDGALKDIGFVLLGIIPKLDDPPEDEDLTDGDFRFTNQAGSAGVLVGRGGIYLGVLPEAELAVGDVTEGALVTVGEAGEGTEEPP